MKRWQYLWLCGLLGSHFQLMADTLPLRTTTGSEFGLQAFGYAFDSDRDGVSDISIASNKLGVTASFTQAFDERWFWGADARYAIGSTAYTNAARGKNSGQSESLLEWRLTLGRDFGGETQALTPFTGVGYRTIQSNLTAYTDAGYISPSRTSSQLYLPLGLTHRVRLGEDSRLSTTLEGDVLLFGTHKTRYTEIVGYTNDLDVVQRRGMGARMAVAYETLGWSAGIFYHYWNIQESDSASYVNAGTVIVATEAHNVSREVGIQIKWRFN